MGIRLDWQVEAERVYEHSGEDPDSRRRRRMRRLQVILLSFGMIIGLITVVGLAVWRLNTVDNALRQSLIDTVQAEIATLRVSDYASFIALQRSDSVEWVRQQNTRFDIYQQMKNDGRIELLGNVIDATVDGQRGRALVEERRDGKRYLVLWFYWRYPDGWRHVPFDYTFWNDTGDDFNEIRREHVTIQFKRLDSQLAEVLSDRVEQWWVQGCDILGCRNVPHLTLEINPTPDGTIYWDPVTDATQLKVTIPSPLANENGMVAEAILPQTLEDALAVKIAERQFALAANDMTPIPTADAAWLRQSAVEWLGATFTGRVDPVYFSFMQSLSDTYGVTTIGQMVRTLTPTSDINILSMILNQQLSGLAIDWRPFFQWRLNLEKTLLTAGRIDEFRAIWDVGNPLAQTPLQQRLQDPTQQTPQVQSAAIVNGPDGVPTATIQATLAGQPVYVTFRLVDNTWKRSA
ncbi:MAG: hypothetical protein KF726_09255 [Anaerolineae bacterium]|nr:hypothetical protein [Anaerolineae bacterium]